MYIKGIIHRLLNRAKDYLFFSPVFDDFWINRLRGKVTCILYHRVDIPSNNNFLTMGGIPVISPEILEEELRFFVQKGVTFLTFEQLSKGLFPSPTKCGFIVTFDDCFLDNYTNGLQILKRLGINAVFLQTTGMIDAEDLLWEHALCLYMYDETYTHEFRLLAQKVLSDYREVIQSFSGNLIKCLRERVPTRRVDEFLEMCKKRFCNQDELSKIARRIYPRTKDLQYAYALGNEIGSHGHHHYKRENIDDSLFEEELIRSSKVLESILGERPSSFSYPFNSYKKDDDEICSKYFSYVATVNSGYITPQTNPLCLPRFCWPGYTKNRFRQRRWLLTGRI